MTLKELQADAQSLAVITRRQLGIKAQNGVVALVEYDGPSKAHSYNPVTHWFETHTRLAEWMDAYRRGFETHKQEARHTDTETLKELAHSETLNLPTPRLQLTWIKVGKTWEHRSCEYTLVLPISDGDIRQELDGEKIATKEYHARIGGTKVDGLGEPPIVGTEIDLPFRDGCHIKWDGAALNLPAFVVCGDHHQQIETRPRQ